ncbi:MAG: FAD-binding protein [Deltaproteobacteria bacterium]|nr:FAD-binding protein [Deltaproteobacteria bacterium]
MDYLEALGKIVGKNNIYLDQVDRVCYSRDMSLHEGVPDAVVLACDTEEVRKILTLANQERFSVVPRGSGTSLTGAVLPCLGGIVLDLSRMNRIKEINRKDHYAIVEPGVICQELNNQLLPNHFFPPDPASASLCSIGGMISTNASGNRAIKYGTTKDYLKALEVVLPSGEVIRTGSLAPKFSTGYDLTHLLCGAEGTLGIITEATLKILPSPEYVAFAQVSFKHIEDGGEAATEILTSGLGLSSCEIFDKVSIDVVNKAMGLGISDIVGCLLFLEIDGHQKVVKEQIERVNEICKKHGMIHANWDDDPSKKVLIWKGRQGIVAALSMHQRGSRYMPMLEDFGVPLSMIPDTIKEIQKVARKHPLPIATFGHVGDGNLHACVIMDPMKKEEWAELKEIGKEFIDLALKHKGTLSAEHGLGIAKASFIHQELGRSHEVMKTIKNSLDPNNILNPGKMGFDGNIMDVLDHSAYADLVQNLDRVISFGKEIDNEIMACLMCGFCRAGCPVYKETLIESKNARGRVILAYNLLTGRINPSKELAEKFYECTLCMNCKVACPAGVRVADIVESARKRIAVEGYLPEIHQALLESMVVMGNPLQEPKEKRTDVYPSTYRYKASENLLFFGCVTSYQDVQIVPNTMRILARAGIDYATMGNEEHCCGYLAYLIGSEQFKDLISSNVERLSRLKAKRMITTCAGCYKTFKDLYPKHAQIDLEVLHIVEYFEKLITEEKLKFREPYSMKVVYHDPCDLGRHMNIYEPPRKILQAIPGVELLEFKENRNLSKCCGGGGGLKAYNNNLSGQIAYRRALDAIELGAEIIVSACPSCKSSLQQASARLRKEKKGRIKVLDLTELVGEALD